MSVQVPGVILDTSVLDKITADLKPRAGKVINKYGLAISGDAAKFAPVDTGALKNSLTSESHMEGDLTFIVQDGVSYGVYQELGTSRMQAHPFITPAVEKWVDKFLKAFGDLFK